MMDDALIHLRVPADIKARWVRESRAVGMRLTDWIVTRVETFVGQKISIPEGLAFSDLQLSRDLRTGDVSFNIAVIERVEHESGLPPGYFMGRHEEAMAALIVTWYEAHRKAGGERDLLAEDLIAEVKAEDAAGHPFSHPPGCA